MAGARRRRIRPRGGFPAAAFSHETEGFSFSQAEAHAVDRGHVVLSPDDPLDRDVEFVTIMHFDSLEAVKRFVGEDYETAYVPPKARELLPEFDARSQHYEIRKSFED